MLRKQISWVIVFVAAYLTAQPAFAQQALSALNVGITDPSGTAVDNVDVTVTNSLTGLIRQALPAGVGWYAIPQILPGAYRVRAQAKGFKTATATVYLATNETSQLNLGLEVGETSTQVEVRASPDPSNRTNALLGYAFDQGLNLSLPLSARNIAGLLPLFPGVNPSERLGEYARDDGGQVNGARNDQQTLTLDGVNINQQEQGGAFDAAIPVILDSVQEFVVHTAGFGGNAGRGSGGQVQLVTRSGGSAWHGSLYEYYRTTGTSARNFFATEATPLIRHLPGASAGGPLIANKLLFFGAYEHHSDRSGKLESRLVPTPEFLDGIVRYQRKDGSLGTLTDGPGGNLELLTGIPGDRWNPALIGPTGFFEAYRPFSTDTAQTSAASADNGTNMLLYRFNAPIRRNRNIYTSRVDYNLNETNNVYFRGTLNDDVRTLLPETFPGFDNATERIDNSKGFAANWSSVFNREWSSNLSIGLTREAFEDTGLQSPYYSPPRFNNLSQTSNFSTAGGARQAINTWNVGETVSWTRANHILEAGGNYRFVDNHFKAFSGLAAYAGPANFVASGFGTANSPALARALGAAEFSNVASPTIVADAVMAATGSISRLSEFTQYDLQGNTLPSATPLVRNLGLQEWDFFLQDTWRWKPTLTWTLGLHYSLQTPPYERNGVQMNWTEDLGQRWLEMKNTTRTLSEFPRLGTELAGRANGRPDYYGMDANNFAPRIGMAWSPDFNTGVLGLFSKGGGQLTVRAGYALTYDRIGGRMARDLQSVGLATLISSQGNSFSIDGFNSIERAPRLGPGPLPREQFPEEAPTVVAGPGPLSTAGIDRGIRSPSNHLVNLTLTKELPAGWVVEGSYVGRFARNLIGQIDMASPPNVRDPASGMTWYEATHELFDKYLNRGAEAASVEPIVWFENAYPEIKTYVEGITQTTFPSVTQAWYTLLLRTSNGNSLSPGPNVPVSQMDRYADIEKWAGQSKLVNSQFQFLGVFGNFSRSNYHAGQFSVRRRFGRQLSLALNYTLSKSMDFTSAAEARGNRPNTVTGEGLAADALNPEYSYALSDFDRRHLFNGNVVVQLPFGTGRLVGRDSGPAINRIIGGWELSGIFIATSGRPWNFTAGRFNHHFSGRDLPHAVGSIPFELTKQEGSGIVPRVFMIPGTAADRNQIRSQNFVNSHPGGPIARNQGRGPGFWNADIALTKNIPLSTLREMNLRVRAEAFNVFNHPNFSIPSNEGSNIDASGTLGEINSTVGTERVMQVSLRLEF